MYTHIIVVHAQKVFSGYSTWQKHLESITLDDPNMQLLLPFQSYLMKMLVRYKPSLLSQLWIT